MKILTLCGSLKFQKEMMDIAYKLSIKGYCVLTPVYPVDNGTSIEEEQIKQMKEAHLKRIDLADVIMTIDINNYIGDSTKREVEYAKKMGKKIIYYSNLQKDSDYAL